MLPPASAYLSELRWHLQQSQVLTSIQKELILEKIASQLTAEGYLLVVAQDDRSQLRNKEIALARFHELLQKSLRRPKPRRATRPSAGAVRQRLEGKKRQGEKKANRRKLND
jgi:ribosome-associated protein